MSFTFAALMLWASLSRAETEVGIEWIDPSEMAAGRGGVVGKGWAETERPWQRLPAEARGRVAPMVWRMSLQPSGTALRFATDSPEIHAEWSGGTGFWHMPASGVAGLDLYVRDPPAGRWRHLATGEPLPGFTRGKLADAPPDAGVVDYLLFLPIHTELETLRIGVTEGSTVTFPAPALPGPPVVFYGTSITQGCCASRAGMGHTSILMRRLDCETINLGFSSAALLEPEIAELLGELNAAVYVLEPMSNLSEGLVRERVEPFVAILRARHPETSILLVDDPLLPADHPKNLALREIHERLAAAGDARLHFLSSRALETSREEPTVDRTHPTDHGFVLLADEFEPVLRRLLDESDATDK